MWFYPHITALGASNCALAARSVFSYEVSLRVDLYFVMPNLDNFYSVFGGYQHNTTVMRQYRLNSVDLLRR